MKRIIFPIVLGGLFISCGGGVTTQSPFYNAACTTGCVTTSSQSIRVTSDSAVMTSNDNQIQVGGTCNPGDGKSNQIQYWVFPPNSTVPNTDPDSFGNYSIGSGYNAYTDYGICDNGRFFVAIPRAFCQSSSLYLDASTACLLGTYPVLTQIITSAVAGTKPMTRGPRATAYFTIQ